jgi:dynein heavy chain
MNVMKTISEVKDVEGKFLGVVDRMKSMVQKLKKHNVPFKDMDEEPMQAIETVHNRYSETYKKVFSIKADILQLQNIEAIEIKKKLD